MTKEEALKWIPILQAYAEGKEIQVIGRTQGWLSVSDPNFDSPVDQYRIKPGPRKFIIDVYIDGSVSVYLEDQTPFKTPGIIRVIEGITQ